MPVWSHDGRSIAFASDRFGNFDVFVMPAAGGEARRLTFHSASELPFSFTPDDKAVLFGAARLDTAANRLFPTGSQPELYKVPVAGGRAVQVLGTPAEDARLSRDGRFLIYHDKKGGENEWRKHHTSAIARDIWVYDTQTGAAPHDHRASPARTARPVFTPDEKGFYYLSEESGSFNVHRMSDGRRRLDPDHQVQDPPRPLPVHGRRRHPLLRLRRRDLHPARRRGARPPASRSCSPPTSAPTTRSSCPSRGGAREFAVSPNGKEIAVVVRGGIFAVERRRRRHQARHRRRSATRPAVSFSPDGNALVYASERDGRWGIYETRRTRAEEPYFYASTVLKETPLVVERPPERRAGLFPRRQGARLRRGPRHPQGPQPRLQADADPAHRPGARPVGRRQPVLPVEPGRQVDPLRLRRPRLRSRARSASSRPTARARPST